MKENSTKHSLVSMLSRFGIGTGLAVLFAMALRWIFDSLDLLILPASHPGLGPGIIDLAIALSVAIVSRSRFVTATLTAILSIQFTLHLAVYLAIVEVPEVTSLVPAVDFPLTDHLLGLLYGPPDPLASICAGVGLALLALRLVVSPGATARTSQAHL